MLAAVVAALLAGLLIGCAASAPAGAAPAVARGACALAPHLACWQDENSTGIDQDIEVFDHNGAPEFWINNAGGTWAGNDKLGVTGKSVFANVAYLTPTPDGLRGELVLDGQVLTATDIAELHMLERAHITLADLRWLASHAR